MYLTFRGFWKSPILTDSVRVVLDSVRKFGGSERGVEMFVLLPVRGIETQETVSNTSSCTGVSNKGTDR